MKVELRAEQFKEHSLIGGLLRQLHVDIPLLILGRYLYWWTISPRRYHTPSSQCFYH
jgi:hypothetical protein